MECRVFYTFFIGGLSDYLFYTGIVRMPITSRIIYNWKQHIFNCIIHFNELSKWEYSIILGELIMYSHELGMLKCFMVMMTGEIDMSKLF